MRVVGRVRWDGLGELERDLPFPLPFLPLPLPFEPVELTDDSRELPTDLLFPLPFPLPFSPFFFFLPFPFKSSG